MEEKQEILVTEKYNKELISEREKMLTDIVFKIFVRRIGAKMKNLVLRGRGASKWMRVLQVIRYLTEEQGTGSVYYR